MLFTINIPETSQLSSVYSVAVLAYLPFVLLVMLFPILTVMHFYNSTFRSRCTVPNMVVCRCLISCFPGMLLKDCLIDFEMVSVASIINGITYAFTLHIIIIIIIIIIGITITTTVLSSCF